MSQIGLVDFRHVVECLSHAGLNNRLIIGAHLAERALIHHQHADDVHQRVVGHVVQFGVPLQGNCCGQVHRQSINQTGLQAGIDIRHRQNHRINAAHFKGGLADLITFRHPDFVVLYLIRRGDR